MPEDPPTEQQDTGTWASPSPAPRQRRTRRRRKRKGPRSGDVFLFFVLFIIIIALVTLRESLADILLSPTAVLILAVMVVEYVFLKSSDRTRVYGMENKRLREKRREDLDLLERARELLQERMDSESFDSSEDKTRWETRAEIVIQDIDDRF